MSSLSNTPRWRRNVSRAPKAKKPAPLDPIRNIGPSRAIVGVLYGANLHTRTYRIEDGLARTHIFKLSDELDGREIASLLGEIVHVQVVAADEGSNRITAIAVDRVAPPETSDYYTWDFETALAGVEPVKSLDDLAIPGLDGEEFEAFWAAVNE